MTIENTFERRQFKRWAGAVQHEPMVLIVDDDHSLAEMAMENIGSLGWRACVATNIADALRLLRASNEIGIVVTDVYLDQENGLTLLENILDEFSERALSFIVWTGSATVETAVSAIRRDAIDFLSKPIVLTDFDRALRRAENRWHETKSRDVADQLADLPDLVSRLSEIIETVGKVSSESLFITRNRLEYAGLSTQITKAIGARRSVKRFFPGVDLSNPNWDILLDVALGQLTKKPVPVSNACLSAGVSMTTALRCIRELVAQGWLVRWTDPTDRRRDLLGVPTMTFESLSDYFHTTSD